MIRSCHPVLQRLVVLLDHPAVHAESGPVLLTRRAMTGVMVKRRSCLRYLSWS